LSTPHELVHPDRYFDFSIASIANVLSVIPRFNGHGDNLISVGHHSLHCLYIAIELGYSPRLRQLALFHDVAEAYTGDIPTFVKRNLGAEAKAYLGELDRQVFEKLGIPYYRGDEKKIIKRIDNTALTLEAEYVFPKVFHPDDWPTIELDLPKDWFTEIDSFFSENGNVISELYSTMKEYQTV
jgi:5'-deoxynucleotidase YfbR-like HD superfamily hydrolase